MNPVDHSSVLRERPVTDWAAIINAPMASSQGDADGDGPGASHVIRRASTALMDATPMRLKQAHATPDERDVLVLRPSDTDDVRAVVLVLRDSGLRYVVTAARSNVIGALDDAPPTVISTERLDEFLAFDPVSHTVTVGAGMLGGDLERWLEARNLTLGQFPQSLDIATIGGWVATRATGSLSACNGGVESAIVGATVVLADGEVLRFRPRARPAGGMDGLSLFLGSEGSLGVITEVSLRVHRKLPELTMCFSFLELTSNLEAQRELVQGSYPVALLRGYNAAETAHILGMTTDDGSCLLMVSTIGPGELVASQRDAIADILHSLGGRRLPDDAAERWFAERFEVGSMMSDRNSTPGSAFDTIEAFVPWSRASECVHRLERELADRIEQLYLHFSHAYPTGVGFYLLLWLSAADDDAVLAVLRSCWDDALAITVEHGGAIGHHHGIGAVRSSAYQRSADARLHARVKETLDPDNLLHARLLAPSP